jgi:hypothetical protein
MSLRRLRERAKVHLVGLSQSLETIVERQRNPNKPSSLEAKILEDIKREGVHVTSIKQLMPELSDVIGDASARALDLLKVQPTDDEKSVWYRGAISNDLSAEALLTHAPEIYLLGLNERILRLVRFYLRLPVAYHGAVLRHSLVDGASAGPRLWHQDAEDFHVLRMVVYLNDVSPGGGPFEYIPRHLGVTYDRFSGFEDALTNDLMRTVVPPEQWKRCFGPAGTIVLCDTAKTFHHESLQTERERTVIMIGYSSRRPKSMPLSTRHFPVERVRDRLIRVVSPANYDHVFNWRRS